MQGRGESGAKWEGYIWVVKWWEVKVWGESVYAICVGKNIRNYIQYFLPLVLFSFCAFLLTLFVLCVLLSSYVYSLYYVCIAVLL